MSNPLLSWTVPFYKQNTLNISRLESSKSRNPCHCSFIFVHSNCKCAKNGRGLYHTSCVNFILHTLWIVYYLWYGFNIKSETFGKLKIIVLLIVLFITNCLNRQDKIKISFAYDSFQNSKLSVFSHRTYLLESNFQQNYNSSPFFYV